LRSTKRQSAAARFFLQWSPVSPLRDARYPGRKIHGGAGEASNDTGLIPSRDFLLVAPPNDPFDRDDLFLLLGDTEQRFQEADKQSLSAKKKQIFYLLRKYFAFNAIYLQ